MTQRLRILLLIPHLGGGGAEQVIALLARGLAAGKYEVHLGLVTGSAPAAQDLPPELIVHELRATRVRTSLFRLLRLVRRLKPALILSGMAHLNFLVLMLRPFFPRHTRVLVRQNGTVSSALAFGGLPGYTRLLYRLLYPRADGIVCQTRAMAEDLGREVGIREKQITVLPNPVDLDGIRTAAFCSPSVWRGPGPHLLAVGRLSREKGFDLLMQALAKVRERFAHADLVIAGSGPEEMDLKALRHELSIEDAVQFAGQVDSPYAYVPGASLYVLSSRHEGLPNSLLEAAAGGLPIVALPASLGIVELLRREPGAWLAPEISAEALAACLVSALQALRPGERFAHPFVDAFRMQQAIQGYEKLIDVVIEGPTLREGQP